MLPSHFQQTLHFLFSFLNLIYYSFFSWIDCKGGLTEIKKYTFEEYQLLVNVTLVTGWSFYNLALNRHLNHDPGHVYYCSS